MTQHRQLAEELIAEAEKWDDFRAGIAAIDEVLGGPSYKAVAVGSWKTNHSEKTTPWLPNARSLLVLAMHHPEDDPRLDWFDRGNTAGNRRMTKISEEIGTWLFRTHGVRAQPLPYHYERTRCIQRLDSDRAHPIESGQRDSDGSPILVTDWCRRCEFACPVGEK